MWFISVLGRFISPLKSAKKAGKTRQAVLLFTSGQGSIGAHKRQLKIKTQPK